MAEKTRTELDTYFETRDTPSQAQFGDLVDSVPNFQDDDDHYGKEINITAHAGGGQADATILTKKVSVVTTAVNANDSIKLPAGNIVRSFYLWNDTANNIEVYPPVGGEIKNNGINVGEIMAADDERLFVNYDDKKWFKID